MYMRLFLKGEGNVKFNHCWFLSIDSNLFLPPKESSSSKLIKMFPPVTSGSVFVKHGPSRDDAESQQLGARFSDVEYETQEVKECAQYC